MSFFDVFKKKVASSTDRVKTNSSGQKLDKLIDGELPWGWASAYADFYGPRDNKLYELSSAATNAKSIDEEIACLKTLISFYHQYKNECITKGECFIKYFSDMHMHCHNSRNPDFDFIVPCEERLKYINENYVRLIEEEQDKIVKEKRKQELLHNINLEKETKKLLISNPGILQSDLYKQFDPLLKDSISEMLYFWAKDGKIRREKSGRTYQLFWEK